MLEGLREGIPIITTKIGGNPEIIENNFSGLVVSPNNSMELANAILVVFQEKDKIKILSTNARRIFNKKFGESKMIQEYLDVVDGE